MVAHERESVKQCLNWSNVIHNDMAPIDVNRSNCKVSLSTANKINSCLR